MPMFIIIIIFFLIEFLHLGIRTRYDNGRLNEKLINNYLFHWNLFPCTHSVHVRATSFSIIVIYDSCSYCDSIEKCPFVFFPRVIISVIFYIRVVFYDNSDITLRKRIFKSFIETCNDNNNHETSIVQYTKKRLRN